jgi:hypothetical protein
MAPKSFVVIYNIEVSSLTEQERKDQMLTSQRKYQSLTDAERTEVDQFLPSWQRYLNNVYEVIFQPIDNLLEYLSTYSTKRMVEDLDKR